MALGKCGDCGGECAQSTKVCPGCGVSAPVKGWTLGAKIGTGALMMVAFVLWRGASSRNSLAAGAAPNSAGVVPGLGMTGIYARVSSDAVAQYEIAKRGGSEVDQCVHAGLVAAAFLQAKDEVNYRRWKATEKADCATPAVPAP